MKISKIDDNGDWTLDVASNDEAIVQNIITRIKSFTNDWFLDYNSHIDFFNLLGQKGTEEAIIREVQRVIIGSEGVEEINSILINLDSNRNLTIDIEITISNYELISERISISV